MRRRRGTRCRLIAGRLSTAGGAGGAGQLAARARDAVAGREGRVAGSARDAGDARSRHRRAYCTLVAAVLWLAAASGAALGGAGCRGGARAAAPPGFPPGAQVLHLAVQDDVPTLDPAAGYDTASWTFEQMIFDTMV